MNEGKTNHGCRLLPPDREKCDRILIEMIDGPPCQRSGRTYELKIGGQKMYLRTGEYEDSLLGEFLIDVSKEGASLRSLINCFAMNIRKGLQYGVPLTDLVRTFTLTSFEPNGLVDHPQIKTAASTIDLVFRILAKDYLGDETYCQIKSNPIEPIDVVVTEVSTSSLTSSGNNGHYDQRSSLDGPFCPTCGDSLGCAGEYGVSATSQKACCSAHSPSGNRHGFSRRGDLPQRKR